MLSQIIAVTGVNLRSIRERAGSSVVAIIGIAGVVIVFVSVLSIAEGFKSAMTKAGDPERIIVLRTGSDTEMTSGFSGEDARLIMDTPGILKGPKRAGRLGRALRHRQSPAEDDRDGRERAAEGRVDERARRPPGSEDRRRTDVRVRPQRDHRRARRDAAVRQSVRRLQRALGRKHLAGRRDLRSEWIVAESELWCDARVLQPAYRRGNTYQSVYARLESADSFQAVKDAMTADPRLRVTVLKEQDYYEAQSRTLQTIIRTIGFIIAGLMGLGAIFGAVNTMYSAVASRTREIATLRALGFNSLPVVISVLVEAIVLSLIGGVIGGLAAYLAFDGYQTATMNWQSFSQVAFAFRVTPALLGQALMYATIMGLLGGLLPAWNAARTPVVTALSQLLRRRDVARGT